ncbi:hypothetical protein [Dinghuibacter silviterrae]|nr:hypothetical protein [Dinghuibacter silviterrae]
MMRFKFRKKEEKYEGIPKSIEDVFSGFARKRTTGFLLEFLNTYFLLINFLCIKYKVSPNRVLSDLFNYLYVGSLTVPTGSKSTVWLMSSGVEDQGKLVWLTIHHYFREREIEGLKYQSVCNLLRFSETELSFLDKPTLFGYNGKIELNKPYLYMKNIQAYGKEIRKVGALYRDELANEYLQYLCGFDFEKLDNIAVSLKIINTKFEEKMIR